VRVDVAFTPAERVSAHVGIVVDVIRATSSIAQALASGYERVLCCAEIDEARSWREELGDEAVVGGERNAIVVDGFDVGASPREFAGPPKARTLILTTTNGTRAILAAAAECDVVLLGSLLNLSAVAAAARRETGDIAVVCSGFKGTFALDDAYCAGRIVDAIGGSPSDAAIAASTLAAAWPDPLTGLNARTYGPPGLEDDIRYCAQVDYLSVVPRFTGMKGAAAEIRGDHD
jgi:2-phosphosulfolactate phosphatase